MNIDDRTTTGEIPHLARFWLRRRRGLNVSTIYPTLYWLMPPVLTRFGGGVFRCRNSHTPNIAKRQPASPAYPEFYMFALLISRFFRLRTADAADQPAACALRQGWAIAAADAEAF